MDYYYKHTQFIPAPYDVDLGQMNALKSLLVHMQFHYSIYSAVNDRGPRHGR